MPHDDITHPIPDRTDTITQCKVFVDNSWHDRQISAPINMLASLSLLINQAAPQTSCCTAGTVLHRAAPMAAKYAAKGVFGLGQESFEQISQPQALQGRTKEGALEGDLITAAPGG